MSQSTEPPLKAAIIPVTPLQQNCSLIWCTRTMRGALVDPGGDLDRLKAAVAESGSQPGPAAPGAKDERHDEEAPPPVSLRQRAYPLIGLLEAAERNKEDVTWAPTRSPLL